MKSGRPEFLNGARRRIAALGLIPLFILIAALHALGPEKMERYAPTAPAFENSQRFRAVVFILDSAGLSEMFDPELMPFLTSLRPASLWGGSRSCAAKTTFPCLKSIFEGREAPMGATLQDFSAFASSRPSWPGSLKARGLRVVVASDHTLNQLYPNAFVDSLNYEDLHAPLREREDFVYRKARQWFDDPSIDVLLLHIIGTDKIAHEYTWRGPEYREKYREVDNFIREIAGRLAPQDYLYAISDHGHNELGGHTEEAGFLVRGPIFPADVRADLHAEDMLFLLSAPYDMLLPANYEGQVRMDLTRLPANTVEQWIAGQANAWRIPVTGLPPDQAQTRMNQELAQRRALGRRNNALEVAWRCAPFMLAAALFLIAELHSGPPGRSRIRFLQVALFALGFALVWMDVNGAGWILVAASLLRCLENFGSTRTLFLFPAVAALGALAFWLFPAGLSWIHDPAHRPLGFIAFYVVAASGGFALIRFYRPDAAWRAQLLDVLWIVGIAVWLLAYFGPLGYSLTRHGSLVVLTLFPIAAIIIVSGWRTFVSWPAAFFPGLLPLVLYDVQPLDLNYPLIDWLRGLAPAGQYLATGFAAGIFALALAVVLRRRWLVVLLLALSWLALGHFFFEFDLGKLIGALLACCWFAGCLELFRRAGLPLRWFALTGAFFVVVLFTFFLNGFALSHVDFRFANDKIIQFQKELWRAPQLIVWAISKYAFALLPALVLLRLSPVGDRVWRELLLLTWWRQLMIAVSAVGLANFNATGRRESSDEELIFWTFLNLLFLATALLMTRPLKDLRPPVAAAAPPG